MYQLMMIINVLAAAAIVLLVLVQQGKGAATGAAFGSGASQTVFGSRGSGSFLLKVTIGFVLVFFSTSIALNYIASSAVKRQQEIVLPEPIKQENSSIPVLPSSIPLPGSTEPMQKK